MDFEKFLSKKLNLQNLNKAETDPKAMFAKGLAPRMADPPLPMELDYLYRDDWLAFAPLRRRIMVTPVNYVRLTETGGATCDDRDACVMTVRGLQEKHVITDVMEDIAYNFLIDHEGRVYEGRGWHVKAELPPKIKNYEHMCVDVCLIGSYKGQPVPECTMKALGYLIKYGVDNKFVKGNYKLLGYEEYSHEKNIEKKLTKMVDD